MRTTSTASAAVESAPALISLFRSGGVFVLNIRDSAFSGVGIAIAQELGKQQGASGIMIVTPDDTRMFNLNGKAVSHAGSPSASPTARATAPSATANPQVGVGTEGESEEEDWEEDPQALAQRLAAEAEREANRIMQGGDAQVTAPPADDIPPDSPLARRRALAQARREAGDVSRPNSACLRCRGVGRTLVAMESGGAVEQNCPVCRGTGQVIAFGRR